MIRKDFPKLGEHYFEERLENGLLVRVMEKPGFAKRYGCGLGAGTAWRKASAAAAPHAVTPRPDGGWLPAGWRGKRYPGPGCSRG
jgi:hypothetical protein